ncbi:MaoC/PaaZ C-terminal domain-containing protein [Anaerolineales bacterium]
MVYLEQVNSIIGFEFPPMAFHYTERDVALYALSIGAPDNWLSADDLKFVYEMSAIDFQVIPSFASLFSGSMIDSIVSGRIGELEFNPMMLVHGEQSIQIHQPLATSAQVISYPRIIAAYDKGSGLLIETEVLSKDQDDQLLSTAIASMFIRGLGGFGGERGTSTALSLPLRQADAIEDYQTSVNQALLYRLNGDINPLHADPAMAGVGGFDRPILHGLCTYGIATRAVIKHFAANDADKVKSIQARFSRHVFPGERLRTEMWQVEDDQIMFQTRILDRDEIALSQALIQLH